MNPPFDHSNQSPRHLYVATAVLAMAVLGGMLYVLFTGNGLSNRLEPQLHATMNVQLETTLAHLNCEEYILTDSVTGLNDYQRHMDLAQQSAVSMLQGGPSLNGYVPPLKDPEQRQFIRNVMTQLRSFRNVATQRLKATNGADHREIDKSFDAIFFQLSAQLNRVHSAVKRDMGHEQAAFRNTQLVLIAICLLLAAVVAAMVLRFNHSVSTTLTQLKERDEQLRQRTQQLEHNNRELEQFAYVASHDLREPLRKIQAFGDRLKQKEAKNLTEQGQDYVARMCNAACRMQALIEGLLLYSRCGTRAQSMALVDLNQVARGALSDLETSIQEHHALVNVGPLPSIHADSMQMGQLFQNMLSNGLKFHEPGQSPALSISAQVNDDNLEISFTDNGIGIPEEQVERIFQVFQRLHGRDEYDGAGVGLSICRKAAERHGGSIEVISKPGQGATFKVHLPMQPAVLETEAEVDALPAAANLIP